MTRSLKTIRGHVDHGTLWRGERSVDASRLRYGFDATPSVRQSSCNSYRSTCQITRPELPDTKVPFGPTRQQESLVSTETEARHASPVGVLDAPEQMAHVRIMRPDPPVPPPGEHHILLPSVTSPCPQQLPPLS